MMMMTETTKTPRRQQQRREDINISSRCSGCAALTSEHRALQQRVEMLQRQLRATANLQHLLAAKDRELAVCRARLEQYEGRRTTASCEEDVQEASEATTPVHEHKTRSSSYVSNEAPVIGQQPSRRCRCNSINRDTSPSRHLATKLMEQNTRLKNLARQMIADRGMTVAQYLEEKERQDVAVQHLLQRLHKLCRFAVRSRSALPPSATTIRSPAPCCNQPSYSGS